MKILKDGLQSPNQVTSFIKMQISYESYNIKLFSSFHTTLWTSISGLFHEKLEKINFHRGKLEEKVTAVHMGTQP